eukprot:g32983.t1
MMKLSKLAFVVVVMILTARSTVAAPPDFNKQIAPILKRYCVGCHNAKDPEAKLAVDSYAGLMKGGGNGKVIQPSNLAKSKLIGMIERKTEPFMPPEGNEMPTAKEIALVKAWVKAGAKGPTSIGPNTKTLITPKIKPLGKVRKPVSAVAYAPDGKVIAIARHGSVEIVAAGDLKPLRTLTGHAGNVTSVVFSQDGKRLFAAAGEPGLFGEVSIWNRSDWSRLKKLRGQHDSLYSLAVSPNGRILATGSYDQTIQLWDTNSGSKLRLMTGHNGPVNRLAFHPGGTILASASGDRTVKLWSVKTGKRLDTLGEPTKGQNAVTFSPDGRFLVAGGIDNRIRVWRISKQGQEGTNPLVYSRFAHEASILNLVYAPNGKTLVSSGEDQTVKFWETRTFTTLRAIKNQSDWPTALAIAPANSQLLVGRLDGSTSQYPLTAARQGGPKAKAVFLAPTPRVAANSQTPPMATQKESEPNDQPANANVLTVPGTVSGKFMPQGKQSTDADLYRIRLKKGKTVILETNAARSKSPADTKIEVLHPDGRPVLRYMLRAVRDSVIEFRPIDSRQTQVRVANWEEMQLNQYLYMGGEVGRLFRAPRGPDSGFEFYSRSGVRRCYFGTSAVVHAKEDPVYIVEPYPPGTELVDNGLPVFPLYYANDDDGDRELGNDSRLRFTAPADGEYLVRVTDVRGYSGDAFKYSLTVREPRPDFRVSISGNNMKVASGSGQRLTVTVDRIDGFVGEVRVHLSGLPKGFIATSPIVVEADHLVARGVIHVDAGTPPTVSPKPKGKPKATKKKTSKKKPVRAAKPVSRPKPIDWSKLRVTATATINGKRVTRPIKDLRSIQVTPKPKVVVYLTPDPQAKPTGKSGELVIAPGSTTTAMLTIDRNGFNGDLKFDVDHLPHGVIVDNIGLSGILVRAGETQRRVYLTAAKWVAETTREIHAVGKTTMTLLSKPINRRQFIIGKYFGILQAVMLLMVPLSLVFLSLIYYKVGYDARESGKDVPLMFNWIDVSFLPFQWPGPVEIRWDSMTRIVPGLVLIFFEAAILTGISVAIATRAPMMVNIVSCLAIYIIGHIAPVLVRFSAEGQFLEFVRFFAQTIATFLPSLELFNTQAAVATGSIVPRDYIALSAVYCAAYCSMSILAMLWSVLSSILLCAALFTLFLIAHLLESRGRVSLTVVEAQQLKDATGLNFGTGTSENTGIGAFVWWTANSPIGPTVASIYRDVPPLQSNSTALAILVFVAIALGLIRSMVLSRVQRLSSRTAFDVVTRMRRTLHRQAMRLGTSDFDDSTGNEVLKLFSDDADRVREAVANRTLRLGQYPFELAVLLTVAMLVDWRVALQCLIPLGFSWYLFQRSQKRFNASRRLNESRAAAELRVLSEGFHKTRLVRGYGMEAFEHDQFQKHLDRHRENAMAVERGHRWYRWTCRGLLLLCTAVLLLFVGMKVLQPAGGIGGLTVSEAALLTATFGLMYNPLLGLSQLAEEKAEASAAADRIYRYLNRIPEVGQAVGAKFLQPLSRSIQFESVWYETSGRRALLAGIDLKIPAGGITAIVSHDPLEARALAYLLPRFIEPQKGRVLIDGEDIAWTTLESLRAETAYVGGSDPFFTGTVLENITCGNPEFSLQDATEAAKTTHANNFILKLPQGFETLLGEHGEQLDAGQGFRLGLARAMLRKPALLLIEEPETPLDVDTKSMLDDAYQRITRDRTVIFLPSRLSTLKRADRIVLISRGRIEAIGKHSELVRSSALYRHWEYLHFNEFRNEAETA